MQNVLEIPRAKFKNGSDAQFLKSMDLQHPNVRNKYPDDMVRTVAFRQMVRASREHREVIQFRGKN